MGNNGEQEEPAAVASHINGKIRSRVDKAVRLKVNGLYLLYIAERGQQVR